MSEEVPDIISYDGEELILWSTEAFRFVDLPDAYCTGSSMMPQKKNPDVLELVRAKTSRVLYCASTATGIVKGLPSGYNRDLQEIKEPFIEGIQVTRSCRRVLSPLIKKLKVDRKSLLAGFTPDVFAVDRALELVAAVHQDHISTLVADLFDHGRTARNATKTVALGGVLFAASTTESVELQDTAVHVISV